MLPTDIYRFINEYANTDLYQVISSITEQECTFNLIIAPYMYNSIKYRGYKYVYVYGITNILSDILQSVSDYPINVISISICSIIYPPVLFLPHIIWLDLSGTRLRTLPELDIPTLRDLYFHDNYIETIPPFNLPSLINMAACDNLIEHIPDFNLPKLRVLLINNNSATVPFFNHLPNLERIRCDTPLPSFDKCPKLKIINGTKLK